MQQEAARSRAQACFVLRKRRATTASKQINHTNFAAAWLSVVSSIPEGFHYKVAVKHDTPFPPLNRLK
jgi:uncharacterized protein YgbK (DUF1537 family)